jgi:hypothetical protein
MIWTYNTQTHVSLSYKINTYTQCMTTFNTEKFYTLPSDCISVILVDSTTVIISVYAYIIVVISLAEMENVYCAVRIEFLNTSHINYNPQRINYIRCVCFGRGFGPVV